MSTTIGARYIRQGIAYSRPQLTGQVTSYEDYDDGWQLANGTYDYTPPIYPISYAQLDTTHATPALNLVENNAFGTKDRLTNITGGTKVTGEYVIDHLTGLGYYTTALSANTWENNLAISSASTQNGYTDWRLTNIKELSTLTNYNASSVNIFGVTDIVSNRLQSSTTRRASTTTMFYWFLTTGFASSRGKVGPDTAMMVRNHYT